MQAALGAIVVLIVALFIDNISKKEISGVLAYWAGDGLQFVMPINFHTRCIK